MTYGDMADAVSMILEEDGPSWRYFQELCSGPPRPLANVTWLNATLHVLGLTWLDVLEALDLNSKNWRREPPQEPYADPSP